MLLYWRVTQEHQHQNQKQIQTSSQRKRNNGLKQYITKMTKPTSQGSPAKKHSAAWIHGRGFGGFKSATPPRNKNDRNGWFFNFQWFWYLPFKTNTGRIPLKIDVSQKEGSFCKYPILGGELFNFTNVFSVISFPTF